LKSIIYYYNCQWGRVNKILEETIAKYQPMADDLKALADSDLQNDEWYELLQRSIAAGPDHGDKTLLPYRVAKRIESDPKFQKFQHMLLELEDEAKRFETSPGFSKSDIGRQMTENALEAREQFLQLVGRFTRVKIKGVATEIDDIATRARIVSLETKSAETDWLEQGRAIDNVARARLPRPFIPDDTFQFWWFRDEFWIDELGYYEYTIKTECGL